MLFMFEHVFLAFAFALASGRGRVCHVTMIDDYLACPRQLYLSLTLLLLN